MKNLMKNTSYLQKSENRKVFTLVLDSHVVGMMDILYDLNHKIGLFKVIIGNKQLWGIGLGQKALNVLFHYGFNNLGLNRLSCHILRYNERGIKLMKKMNMHIDGILREHQYIQGRYIDEVIFSILRKEFEGGDQE